MTLVNQILLYQRNSNKISISFEEKEKSIEINKTEYDVSPKIIYVNKLVYTPKTINNKNEIKESLFNSKESNTDKANVNLILGDNEKNFYVFVFDNNYIKTKKINNTNNKKELKNKTKNSVKK